MPFCPECQFEYKPGVIICPDCGSVLVEKLPDQPELEPVTFIHLRDVPSRIYAEMLKEALESEGIPSIIKGDDLGMLLGWNSTSSAVRISIWVDRNKLFEAKEIAQGILGDI